MPSNRSATDYYEAHDLAIAEIVGCNGAQVCPEFVPDSLIGWMEDDNLLVPFEGTCSITFELSIDELRSHPIELYLALSPHAGTVQPILDGVPRGEPVDLAAPITLGIMDLTSVTIHTLTLSLQARDFRATGPSRFDGVSIHPEP